MTTLSYARQGVEYAPLASLNGDGKRGNTFKSAAKKRFKFKPSSYKSLPPWNYIAELTKSLLAQSRRKQKRIK